MGHYRNEMVSDKDDRQRAEEIAVRRKRLAKNIQADIVKRGVESVLADMLVDPVGYRISKSE